MSTDFEEMRREMQAERETRMRELIVRKPDGRDAARSGGVVLDFNLSKQGGTLIDCNPGELRAWAEAMLAFADELDHGFEPERFDAEAPDLAEREKRAFERGDANGRESGFALGKKAGRAEAIREFAAAIADGFESEGRDAIVDEILERRDREDDFGR